MPDPTGKLYPEEFQLALNWVNSKWIPGVPCELCGNSNKWFVGEYIVAPPNLGEGGVRLPTGFYYPAVPVLCSNCGNTKYLNAIVIGIIKSTPR
jgi:hypothetical protein